MSSVSELTEDSAASTEGEPVIEAIDLKKYYSMSNGILGSLLSGEQQDVHAVDGVSLTLHGTDTLGLVGESGCGKSTLARTLARLEKPTSGQIRFRGEDITSRSERSLRSYRNEIQFIHQDPSSSLNPRKRVKQILSRPLELHTDLDEQEREERIIELLSRVGLDPGRRDRYPHAFSGGQRQRIEIARALSVNPSIVIADEPTSALDVTVQAQILQLLEELQEEFDLSMLFISHDLRTIRYIADRVSVMYLGQFVETGPTETVFDNPHHPYTQSLLSAAPSVTDSDRQHVTLKGEPPDPVDPPTGCRFHPRCPVATEECSTVVPEEVTAGTGQSHRCHYNDSDIFEGTASIPATGSALDTRTEKTGDQG
jgi:oligopeptide/dipeptide ABC transporter ATP-binding protein